MKNTNRQKITGADQLLQSLIDEKVHTIFGYPGGAILPVYDSLTRYRDAVTHITTGAEAGAAHAAEGFARSSGQTGVVIVTSGPGALNTVIAVKDALSDSIPLIVITGQVPRERIGTEAFQEADIVGTMTPNAKHVYSIRDANDIQSIVAEAFYIANSGRPGPVVIDFPKDVQQQIIDNQPNHGSIRKHIMKDNAINHDQCEILEQVAGSLSKAEKPVIIFGNGVRISGHAAIDSARELIDQTQIPVVETLLGRGTIETQHKMNLGMGGMHGLYEANMAMQEANLIVNIGARFDDRFIGKPDTYAPNATVVHIDIDPCSLTNPYYQGDTKIAADAQKALECILNNIQKPSSLSRWHDQIQGWVDKDCLAVPQTTHGQIHPGWLMKQLNKAVRSCPDYTISTEVGQHQMWAAQHFDFHNPAQWLTSGGLGTMGYGLPSAIGAAIANPNRPSFLISGDASFFMNMQEINTAVCHALPLKMVVLNGKGMGMVQQWQNLQYEGRQSASVLDKYTGYFSRVFTAMGGRGSTIEKPHDLARGIDKMINARGPYLLEVVVSDEACYPMVPAGKANSEMILNPR